MNKNKISWGNRESWYWEERYLFCNNFDHKWKTMLLVKGTIRKLTKMQSGNKQPPQPQQPACLFPLLRNICIFQLWGHPKVIFNLSTYNVLALFATVLGSLSILVWEILWTEEPGRSMGNLVHGVTQSLTCLTQLSTHTHRTEKVCLLRKRI